MGAQKLFGAWLVWEARKTVASSATQRETYTGASATQWCNFKKTQTRFVLFWFVFLHEA
jgi:hypothetical protein